MITIDKLFDEAGIPISKRSKLMNYLIAVLIFILIAVVDAIEYYDTLGGKIVFWGSLISAILIVWTRTLDYIEFKNNKRVFCSKCRKIIRPENDVFLYNNPQFLCNDCIDKYPDWF